MEQISIVVPIYKVEAFLDRCVASLVNQTYQNLEIILVDDGSPDRCGQICDEWAKKDARIRVIHKENGGLSDARNAGIGIATGKYIAFIDSDDWVSKLYIEKLYQIMQLENGDIAECEIVRTAGEEPVIEKKEAHRCYTPVNALEELIRDGVFHQYVWNKLYRRSVLEGILFEKGKTNEDEFWTYQVFGRAKKIVKLDIPLYYYYQRPDSIMGTQYSIKRLDALEAKQQRQQYIDTHFPELSAIAQVNLFASCIYAGQMTLKCLTGEEKKKAKVMIDCVQHANRPGLIRSRVLCGTEKMWILLACLQFWGTCQVKNWLGKGV